MPPTPRRPNAAASSSTAAARSTLGQGLGKGRVGGVGGKGLGKALAKRHRKVMKDTIRGITKPDIRRLARRGGVKRISAQIYEEARHALVTRLKAVLHDCVIYLEHSSRKTVTVTDVIFALKRIGTPIYGFDADTYKPKGRK
ncbi:uncharacterized protein LAJ45_05263 [Morchella importuna]|uniref:Histone H4 n=1 Tax=Morchella conica CCBAS932 TaxID=1392247 RepID=A0A3N4L1U1_9PEZI|nr:uncharacterized protein LAJ45_05263 [Morchella importuna]KAH8150567.1 hypothetical protein LAJ45_05263 [Morchella importuna]RPB14551.1 histone-fold-containing protein [Morchella conica CCBAS932]